MMETATPASKLVILAGSAGALDPIRSVFRKLSESPFDLAVLVATHGHEEHPTRNFLDILSKDAGKRVLETRHRLEIKSGEIYVASIGAHLTFGGGTFIEQVGPKSRHWRPAIDDIVRSAARHFGERLMVVILSGAMDDGIAGLTEVWQVGGKVVVQDPGDARFSSMPWAAILRDHPDLVAPTEYIGTAVRAFDNPALVAHADEEQVEYSVRQ